MTHALHEPRAGFDRIDLTSWHVGTKLPAMLPGYRRLSDERLGNSFQRVAKYCHVQDATAALIDVIYCPRGRALRPTLRLRLRATMARLLDISEVARICEALRPYAVRDFIVCEIELTVDYPPRYLKKLRQVYVPRVRTLRMKGSWRCAGSRRSACSLRSYAKTEAALSCARVELVLRRDVLRRLKVKNLHELADVDWASEFASRAQFLKVDGRRCRSADERKRYTNAMAEHGVNAVLRSLPRAERERLRRRLCRSQLNADVARLLESMSQNAKASINLHKDRSGYEDTAGQIAC